MINEQTETLSRWVLPDNASDADREKHAIQASDVVQALRAGRAVEISNAIVVGPLTLRSLVILGELQIRRTVFRGPADWSYTTFKRLVSLEHSTFEDRVLLRAATLEQDLVLDHATFAAQLAATYVTVAGAFGAQSATFGRSPLFDNATFKQDANLTEALFAGGAHFGWARFESEANFSKTRFQKLATFNGTSIRGGAFFGEATFEEKADFPDARFGGVAYFEKARFTRYANFGELRADGNLNFSGAVFEDEAYFNGLRIEGSAFFESAQIEATLNMAASRIRGAVNFQHAVLNDADFSSTEIQGGAYFAGSTFKGYGRFQNVTTTRAVFNDASFKGNAIFCSLRCSDDALFIGTVFSQLVSFEDASLQSIQFSRPGTQFQQTLDLRGCTYSRLDPVEYWEELMARLKPYNRQPFTHLEELLRRSGHDRTARDVYYWRRRLESRRIKLWRPLSWLLDRTLWLLTGYGVRLERLFIATALILIVATFMFQREGAVMPRESPSATVGAPAAAQTLTLRSRDAFWFSLKLFVPVDIPAAGDWRPSSSVKVLGLKMTTVATLLRLAGWILVPIGLAGVTGFLKR